MTAHIRKRPKEPLDHEPEAVTWAREKAGLTRTALAEAIGRSLSLVSEIEAGTRNATPEVIGLLAVALNCPRVVLERKRESEAGAPAVGHMHRVRGEERADQRGADKNELPQMQRGAVERPA